MGVGAVGEVGGARVGVQAKNIFKQIAKEVGGEVEHLEVEYRDYSHWMCAEISHLPTGRVGGWGG